MDWTDVENFFFRLLTKMPVAMIFSAILIFFSLCFRFQGVKKNFKGKILEFKEIQGALDLVSEIKEIQGDPRRL